MEQNTHIIRYPHRRLIRGFTLIEILVVMAIIGMLAVMVAPNLFRQQAGAMRDAALSQISSLETALDSYRLDMNEYPDSLSELMENESGSASWNGPYLRRQVPARFGCARMLFR